MWCPSCQAEVAAEVTVDNKCVRCATCGSEVALAPNMRTSVRTREARELLERWANDRETSNESLPTPHFSNSDRAPSRVQESSTPAEPAAAQPRSKPKFRIDRAHGSLSSGAAPELETPAAKAEQHILNVRAREQSLADNDERFRAAHSRPHASFAAGPPQTVRSPRIHQRHAVPFAPPHFNVQTVIQNEERIKTNWTSVAGQLLAYGGVALLTIGSSLVLWGYFGGPESYAPTGWLITTAGQMLLFLGVVTLVSGGMEQTTDEVKRRIEHLGDRFLRIEQATHELRGPYIPAEYYDDPDAIESDRESEDAERTHRRSGHSRGSR